VKVEVLKLNFESYSLSGTFHFKLRIKTSDFSVQRSAFQGLKTVPG
jgi:hypothetical protein